MRSQRSRLVCALALAVWVLIACSGGAAAQDGRRPYFQPDIFAGRTWVYSLNTTGSIQVQGDGLASQTSAVELSAVLYVRAGEADPASGNVPLTLTFANVNAGGFEQDIVAALARDPISATLSRGGVITEIDTPRTLAELGIDMTDILFGLVVPRPSSGDPTRDQWQAVGSRVHVGPTQTRNLRLEGTYTDQGLKEWGTRSLAAVTGRLRAATSFQQTGLRTEIEEIGHALFYLDPETSVTEISSVSVVTTIQTTRTGGGSVRTRISLTTTLERRSQPGEVASPAPSQGVSPAPESPPASAPPASALPSSAPPESEPSASEPPVSQPTAPETPQAPEAPPTSETPSAAPPDTGSEGAAFGTYEDPAGRFSIRLPLDWTADTAVELTFRGTTLARRDGRRILYVYVMSLPSPGASAQTVARSALTTYQETLAGFDLLQDLLPRELDGQAAYLAGYEYTDDKGVRVHEWSLFARYGERAYYVQYATPPDVEDDVSLQEFEGLVAGFRFGPTPRGSISPAQLAASLTRYVDPRGMFSMMVPGLWPLVDTSQDGSSTTFTEIGGAGYLTVFAQSGAAGLTAAQIVSAWKEEWSKEEGFVLIDDVRAASLGSRPGVRLDYRWSGSGGTTWTRRLHAAVVDDYLFAVSIDYLSPGFDERQSVFDEMIATFAITPDGMQAPPAEQTVEPSPAMSSEPSTSQAPEPETGAPAPTPSAPAAPEPTEPAPATPAGQSAPSTEAGADDSAIDPPDASDGHLVMGRILTRYYSEDGSRLIEEPAADSTVEIAAGPVHARGTTDSEGYFFVPNLEPLRGTLLYTLTRVEGPLFGFSPSVAVVFDNLQVGAAAPRVAQFGTVIVTLNPDMTLSVDIQSEVTGLASGPSAPERFLDAFASSAWVPYVSELFGARTPGAQATGSSDGAPGQAR